MAQIPYWHLCQRLNNGLARHLTGEKIGLPLMVRTCRTPVHLLGCSIEQFATHIESQFHDGMTWGSRKRWHIDHIFPLVAVDVCDDTDVFAACNYRNLRPLWKLANLRKHSRVDDAIVEHFRQLRELVRQPWHRYHKPHPADVVPDAPPRLTSADILAMPAGEFAGIIAKMAADTSGPRYGDFVPP
jgi:hypothetical protein